MFLHQLDVSNCLPASSHLWKKVRMCDPVFTSPGHCCSFCCSYHVLIASSVNHYHWLSPSTCEFDQASSAHLLENKKNIAISPFTRFTQPLLYNCIKHRKCDNNMGIFLWYSWNKTGEWIALTSPFLSSPPPCPISRCSGMPGKIKKRYTWGA